MTTSWESVTKVFNRLFTVRVWKTEQEAFFLNAAFAGTVAELVNSPEFASLHLVNDLAQAILALNEVTAVEIVPNEGDSEHASYAALGLVLYKDWP